MRNRFHKEPVDPNNIIRPDQAGTKENPDYVVNIQGNSKTHIVPHIDKLRRRPSGRRTPLYNSERLFKIRLFVLEIVRR